MNKCDLENVMAEVDVSEQWEVDSKTGKAVCFIETTEGDSNVVGTKDDQSSWRYYCPQCSMITHSWNAVLKAHKA